MQENYKKKKKKKKDTAFLIHSGPLKSMFQIIHAATYITVFLPDSNNGSFFM